MRPGSGAVTFDVEIALADLNSVEGALFDGLAVVTLTGNDILHDLGGVIVRVN
jgi:hypothetical protein